MILKKPFQKGNAYSFSLAEFIYQMFLSPLLLLFPLLSLSLSTFLWKNKCAMKLSIILTRRQDSSIGFGAPVRANMRAGGVTDAVVTSSLLESV